MGLRINWPDRGGWRASESVKIGPVRIGESIPIGRKTKNGRKRRTRRRISFRL